MPDGVGEGHVDARPEKRFFVDMLTRDIELAPAIIDLVDNSIDGAKRLRPEAGDDRFDGLSVQMRLESDLFEISDTCGGFSRQHAASYAFKFGRHRDQEATPGEVGQFGVGMKRAIFKLGRDFTVASRTDDDLWRVEVDVDWWLDELAPDDWTFPFADSDSPELERPGTLVRCTNLLPSAARRLGQGAFVSRVLREIAMRHAQALQQGLVIEVNGRALQPRPPFLLCSDALQPISYTDRLEDSEGQSIEMRIAAGLATADDGDEETDTDDPELFTGLDAAGWYVFCNGRALLFADRSRLTGWAEEVPRFHPQFRRFRGYVYLSGDSAAMPWNTSKTAVDEDSEIWEQTRRHIVDALRKAIRVMNRLKREVQQRPPDDRPLVAAVKASQPMMLERLVERRTFALPDPPPRITADARRISYSVSSEAFTRAADAMETSKASEIGQRTFAYWMRREVDENFDA
jgi:Histidine kinase-, DNA gyrase B-, and HSP90-like ATPase